MSRPKGSKNKIVEGGNPAFNIKDAKPVDPSWKTAAPAAITAEDLALEARLQSMEVVPLPIADDPEPIGMTVKKIADNPNMLSEVMEDYRPASTEDELRNQVHMAKQEGCDSIEATVPLAKRFCRDPQLEKVGYFIYHNIKVYLEGFTSQSIARDNQTIEQRLFGAPK